MNRLVPLICAILFLLTHAVSAQEPARKYSDAQWLEDIDSFETQLRETHLNLFHSASEEEFMEALAALRTGVADMSDSEISLELIRLAATIHDGHTYTFFGQADWPARLPISIHDFEDGVFVTLAVPEFEHLVGRRVIAIGDKPVEELLGIADDYTSRDNEWLLRARRIRWLVNTAFLQDAAGLDVWPSTSVRVRDAYGSEEHVEMRPVETEGYNTWAENQAQSDVEVPLYRQRMDEAYWMTFLEEADAVYMQFNAVQNREDGPHLAGFSRELMDFVEEKKAKKLIIDVRHNGGGNGSLLKPLIRRISENERINQPGRLFVITSRYTFSAALMFTVRMDRNTHALFAGEPGGGKPNSYSEYNEWILPNSGMRGSISSLFHEEGEPGDTRAFVPVDIPVPLTSRDYFEGNDPVLAAVLAYD